MENERLLQRERHQIELILELDHEELQVEEVDALHDSSDDGRDVTTLGNDAAEIRGEFTFNTDLASLHSYLGEVEDTHQRMSFLDGGATLSVYLFYLEGVVLFPEAILPLRVIQSNYISAVERALVQVDLPYIIGVVHIYRDSSSRKTRRANVGTTAEIRQFRRLEDGSLNVVTRGKQRFRLKRCWMDEERVPRGEIQIIQEDFPLRTPQEALGELIRLNNNQICNHSCTLTSLDSCVKSSRSRGEENDIKESSEESFDSELLPCERKIHEAVTGFNDGYEITSESTSGDEEMLVYESEHQYGRTHVNDSGSSRLLYLDDEDVDGLEMNKKNLSIEQSVRGKRVDRFWETKKYSRMHRIPKAFWPDWVYRMYDSYCLSQRAADMWKQIVGTPSMDALVKSPGLISFYIASKLPVSESMRQELLEIDGISYRLRREIELLKSMDLIKCRSCQMVIARRRDMLVMSSEGPLGAYVNPHGSVHEIVTLYKASGLALRGQAETEYSWFPGYAWTITNCSNCETHLGWCFTATNKKLKPSSFWGIRSSKVADAAAAAATGET